MCYARAGPCSRRRLRPLARLSEAATRSALWTLLRAASVTNDQFDILRKGEPPRSDAPPPLHSRGELRAFLRDTRRRTENRWPEGRWSLVPWGQPDPQSAAFFQARLLLERYGIVARELAVLSATPMPWRILYEVLSRMELAGEVRRGYFVAGLSGAQFALPEAAKLLQDLSLPSQANAPITLIHSLDPGNLHGSGAPFELLLAAASERPGGNEAEPRTFQRRPGNWLALKAGQPVLAIEQHGKRLTALPLAARGRFTCRRAAPTRFTQVDATPRRPPQAQRGNVERSANHRHHRQGPPRASRLRPRLPGNDAVRSVAIVRLRKPGIRNRRCNPFATTL